jgi:hypothetical protein
VGEQAAAAAGPTAAAWMPLPLDWLLCSAGARASGGTWRLDARGAGRGHWEMGEPPGKLASNQAREAAQQRLPQHPKRPH